MFLRSVQSAVLAVIAVTKNKYRNVHTWNNAKIQKEHIQKEQIVKVLGVLEAHKRKQNSVRSNEELSWVLTKLMDPLRMQCQKMIMTVLGIKQEKEKLILLQGKLEFPSIKNLSKVITICHLQTRIQIELMAYLKLE